MTIMLSLLFKITLIFCAESKPEEVKTIISQGDYFEIEQIKTGTLFSVSYHIIFVETLQSHYHAYIIDIVYRIWDICYQI